MKLFLVAFAVIAAVAADVSELPSNEYLPPVQQDVQTIALPSNEYLAPVEQGDLAADGYRYKTNKRVVLRRHRRDVSELSNEYLPPVQEPTNEYLPPVQTIALPSNDVVDQGNLAADGYRYKTNRRVVLRRHRRDVSELSNEYLPPVQEPTNEYLPPVVDQGNLAADGYRYKTNKRVVLRRHRRDVNELPSNEYLPPVQQDVQTIALPSNEYLAPVEQGDLAADGYRYKTNKRVVLRRHRRDVNELSNEYLPPVQEPTNEYLPPVQQNVQTIVLPSNDVVDQGNLAADGYRYKTNKRVVLRRHRRDVNELPSNEYLPPVQQDVQTIALPSNEYLAPVEQGDLAVDGYRYKTNKRVVLRRHRRDVNELPSNEYLPPVQQDVQTIALPSNEYLAPVEQGDLAADGYRYKTNKRVVLRRHRRDVSELSNNYLPPVAAPSNDYLPPVQAAGPQVQISEPSVVDVGIPAVETELGADGYRYKTNRRVVYRRRH